jgi:hypothetical protein
MPNYFNRLLVTNESNSILQNYQSGSNSDSLLYVKTIRVSNSIVATPMTNRWINDQTTTVLSEDNVQDGIPLSLDGKTYLMLEVVGVSENIDVLANGLNDSLVVLVTNKSTQTDAENVTAYHVLNAPGQNILMPWHITNDNIDALCNLDMGLGQSGSGKYYDVRVSVSYTRP